MEAKEVAALLNDMSNKEIASLMTKTHKKKGRVKKIVIEEEKVYACKVTYNCTRCKGEHTGMSRSNKENHSVSCEVDWCNYCDDNLRNYDKEKLLNIILGN